MTIPRVLIIAGSDSSGGAGIEADSRVLATHGVYTMTATTALTIQNTMGVQDVIVTPPEAVGRMIKANLDDIDCDAVKIGMLASAETVQVVAEILQQYKVNTIVLDPVMVSTSGSQLLPQDAVRNLREKLIPLCTVVTPNIPEATLLLRDANISHTEPSNLSDLKSLAREAHRLGAKSILLKGGHMPLTKSYEKASTDAEKHLTVDILYDGHDLTTIESPYQQSKSTHGTGCSLASAIAAHLAQGHSLPHSITNSIHYVATGIRTATPLGHGSGPINHFHNTYHLPFSHGKFIPYLLSRPDVLPVWEAYTEHPFPRALADNTLALTDFKSYLIQDYLYLTHFARSHALSAFKAPRFSHLSTSASIIRDIETEMALHLEYCAGFGLSRSEIENTPESQACVAYSRFVIDVGLREDWMALQMALLPCLVGYAVTATRLHAEYAATKDGNPYWKWIENYASAEYAASVESGSALVEEYITRQSPQRIEELVGIFVRATEMEVKFWEVGAHEVSGAAGTKDSYRV